MDLTDREKDLLETLKEVFGSALSLYVPFIGPALAGYNKYKESIFKRNVEKMIKDLFQKLENIDNIKNLFSDEWLKTEEGRQFSNKVFDCVLDAQIEEKQELFVNTLINGIQNKNLTQLEKLKFIDILRQLSLLALNVLADIHPIYSKAGSSPLITKSNIVESLSKKYPDPYLIEAAVDELQAVGLFSHNIEYLKLSDGKYRSQRSYSEGNIAYTNFTSKFVKFILYDRTKKLR